MTETPLLKAMDVIFWLGFWAMLVSVALDPILDDGMVPWHLVIGWVALAGLFKWEARS